MTVSTEETDSPENEPNLNVVTKRTEGRIYTVWPWKVGDISELVTLLVEKKR